MNNNEKREALYYHPINVSWFYNVEHSLNSLWSRMRPLWLRRSVCENFFCFFAILFTFQSLALLYRTTRSWTSPNLFWRPRLLVPQEKERVFQSHDCTCRGKKTVHRNLRPMFLILGAVCDEVLTILTCK